MTDAISVQPREDDVLVCGFCGQPIFRSITLSTDGTGHIIELTHDGRACLAALQDFGVQPR